MNPRPACASLSVEPLEDRRLMSFGILFTGNGPLFSDGPFFPPAFELPQQNQGLPAPVLAPARGALELPQPPIGLLGGSNLVVRSSGRKAFDLRGSYEGIATINSFGNTPVSVDITRQRKSTIRGTIDFPEFGQHFAGSVPVTFLGNRRFSIATDTADGRLEVVGRLNRNSSLTGTFEGTAGNRQASGSFDLQRVA